LYHEFARPIRQVNRLSKETVARGRHNMQATLLHQHRAGRGGYLALGVCQVSSNQIHRQWGKIQVIAKARPLPGRSPEKGLFKRHIARTLCAQKRGQRVVTTKAAQENTFICICVCSSSIYTLSSVRRRIKMPFFTR
jgi:hypothetical protein